MKPATFRYRRAATLAEAVAELSACSGTARVLAGGQTLVQEMSARQTAPDLVIDINHVSELDYLRVEPHVVRIGAMTRIVTVEQDPTVASVMTALAESAARIAHPAIRNRGTAGGNIAHADPSSGIPPVLLAYDGEVVLTGPAGMRTVAARDFFTGYRRTATAADEIVTELRFPRPTEPAGSAFAEISRRARGWGLVGACAVARLDGEGRFADLRLALLGLAPTAVRSQAEQQAIGESADRSAAAALADAAVAALQEIPEDVHASAELRRRLGRIVVRRAISKAVDRARSSS